MVRVAPFFDSRCICAMLPHRHIPVNGNFSRELGSAACTFGSVPVIVPKWTFEDDASFYRRDRMMCCHCLSIGQLNVCVCVCLCVVNQRVTKNCFVLLQTV